MAGNTYFHRSSHNENYSCINNTVLRDKRLSWKAKGLLCYLLTLPSDWKIYRSELVEHSCDGKQTLSSAIQELEEYGYIVKHLVNAEGGKFGGYSYEIYETPLTEKPSTVKPSTEKPSTENQTLLNTNNTNYLDKLNINNIVKAYNEVRSSLFSQKKLNIETVAINYPQVTKLVKTWLRSVSEEQLCNAIKSAAQDDWIVNNGFALGTILSASVMTRLLSKAPQSSFSVGKENCDQVTDNSVIF